MIITTTTNIEGRSIAEYLGVCSGEAVVGANIFRDLFASIRDVVGGRSGSYEKVLADARQMALDHLEEQAAARGADAIVGVNLDYEVLGDKGSMLMVVATGTAVRLGQLVKRSGLSGSRTVNSNNPPITRNGITVASAIR